MIMTDNNNENSIHVLLLYIVLFQITIVMIDML